MHQVHLFCFLASYAAAFFLELARYWKPLPPLRWLSLIATVAGLIAQTWYLISRSIQSQLPPLVASNHDWLLVAAWLLVAGYLGFVVWNLQKRGAEAMGLFVLPLALLMVGASSLVSNDPDVLLDSQRVLKMLHASSLVIGITGVLAGFLISVMYLLQHRRLKKKQNLRGGFSLPALASLARYNLWSVSVSMPMLTLGLLTGFLLIGGSEKASRPVSWQDPIVIGFTIVWLGMVLSFGGLFKKRSMQGRQIALMNAWAFGFLIITLLGLQILVNLTGLPSQHG